MKRIMLSALLLWMTAPVVMAGDSNEETAKPSDNAGKATTELGDPIEILKKADAALRKVKVARYKAQYNGTAWVTAFVPSIDGSAALGEVSEHDIARFRCEVNLTPIGLDESKTLSAGSDGDLFFLIDPERKTVYADIDEAVLGTHQRDVQRVLMREFVAKEPLADDLKAEKVELKETAEVGGETCYQVHVTRSADRGIIWYISKEDWLPRRVERLYKNPQGELGATQLVLTDLAVETTLDPEVFKLTVPDGYTKTDEFAP